MYALVQFNSYLQDVIFVIRDYFIYCAFFKSLFRVRLQIFDNVDKQTVVSYFLVVGQAPALLTAQHTNMKS